MKKIYRILASALLLFQFTGCSDFLDVTDETSVSPENFPSNMEHVDLLLNSVYAGSHQIGLYAYYWFPEIMYLLDNTHDCFGDYDDRSTFLTNSAMPSNVRLEKAYGNIMQWIQFANTAIEGCDKYAPSAAESELKQLDYMKGQALFFRALAYWHSQIFFELESKDGAMGFPIISKVPLALSEMTPPRATAAETWQFTIDTLLEAIPLLEGYTTDKTRVTVWAAKGLLAKVYMQARRPGEAIPVLEDIFANSGASLLDYPTYAASFYADEKYEFNKETLFELDFTVNEKQNGPWAGFTTGSGMQMVMAPWFVNLDYPFKTTPTGETEMNTYNNGGWGNNFVSDGSVLRFGYPLPIAPVRVLNPSWDKNARVKTKENYALILDPDYAVKSQIVRDEKLCDPRLFISGQQPFFDTFIDARQRETWVAPSPESLDLGADSHYYFMPKKFCNLQGQESDLNFSSGANIPVIRLADLYLLYAEAISTSDPGRALEYVNKVHRRAYGMDPDAVSGYDYGSLTSETPAAANYPDDILAHDPVKYERWAELFAEGQWWYDVRRYEILENEMKIYKSTRYGSPTYMERSYSQPIPLTEIERYNGNIIQNYNY